LSLVLRKVRGDDWLPDVGGGRRSDDDVAAGHFQDPAGVSLWTIDPSETNLERVIAAIAACRDFLKPVEYLVFPETILAELGIPLVVSEGDTPDAYANSTWHRHLAIDSQAEALRVVRALRTRGAECEPRRCPKPTVKMLLVQSVQSGHIQLESLKDEVRTIVAKTIAQLGQAPHS